MVANSSEVVTLHELLDFYFRHQWKILVIFFVATAGVTALVYYFPEKYEVQAKLLVKLGRENASISPTVSSPNPWSVAKQMKEVVQSEVELLDDTRLIEELVEELGVDFFVPPRPPPKTMLQRIKAGVRNGVAKTRAAALWVAYELDILRKITLSEQVVLGIHKNLRIVAADESNVITAVYKTPDPDTGRRALDRLLQRYLANRVTLYKNDDVYGFFKTQVTNYEHLLKAAEEEVTSFKAAHAIASLETQRDLLLKEASAHKTTANQTRTHLREMVVRAAELETQRADLGEEEVQSREVWRNPLVQAYDERIADLQLKRVDLGQHFRPGSQTMVVADRSVAELQDLSQAAPAELLARVVTGPNPSFKNVENQLLMSTADLAGLRAKLASEEEVMADLIGQLEQLNTYDRTLVRLSRNAKIIEDNYLLYKRKLEEARIQQAMDRRRLASVSIAGPASSSIVPLKKMRFIPRKIYFVSLAMFTSLMAGVVYALLLDYLAPRVRDETDVARVLDTVVLGTFFVSKDIRALLKG